MKLSKNLFTLIILAMVVAYFTFRFWPQGQELPNPISVITDEGVGLDDGQMMGENHPLSVLALREAYQAGEYDGSQLEIVETLSPGSNYQRYVVSYLSEGLTIYALLTVPNGEPPAGGWPAVIFNHGYISPSVYRTTERYVAYQDAFARNGYVTIKSDYRGHGSSEGEARGGYGSNDYTIDVLNTMSSVQQRSDVNPEKIGMWGHSMGGHITLESMVVSEDIKAGVIWAGVVGSYQDIFSMWGNRNREPGEPQPTPTPGGRGWWRYEMSQIHGSPEGNPEFWDSLSATTYLDDISGPIQLHHGTADSSVDVELSELLDERMRNAGKEVETFIYQGDDHNLSANLSLALRRSVEFFDEYLK